MLKYHTHLLYLFPEILSRYPIVHKKIKLQSSSKCINSLYSVISSNVPSLSTAVLNAVISLKNLSRLITFCNADVPLSFRSLLDGYFAKMPFPRMQTPCSYAMYS